MFFDSGSFVIFHSFNCHKGLKTLLFITSRPADKKGNTFKFLDNPKGTNKPLSSLFTAHRNRSGFQPHRPWFLHNVNHMLQRKSISKNSARSTTTRRMTTREPVICLRHSPLRIDQSYKLNICARFVFVIVNLIAS